MKIILSRKGFDSECGGYPSPILPDGRLISLPIPSSSFNPNSTHYSDLCLDENTTYSDLMQKLSITPKLNKKDVKGRDAECHLDPDIYRDIIPRMIGWKPLFGQIDAAQTHLFNKRVNEGDLFLFFGWFRKVIQSDGTYRFDENNHGIHIIFGYLQIGEIVRIRAETTVPEWMNYHPHTFDKSRVKNNTVYIAREILNDSDTVPGAGVFRYDDSLVLTKRGFSRSKWCLPECIRGKRISYHNSKSWQPDYFQSTARGQEFVIEENIGIEEWANKLIYDNHNRR